MAEEKAKKTTKKAAPAASAKKPAAAAAKAAPDGPTCRVEKCNQVVRAKGYCRKHFIAWRRGDVGNKHSYKTCSKEGCRKPAVLAGRCEEHGKNKKAAAEAAPAA